MGAIPVPAMAVNQKTNTGFPINGLDLDFFCLTLLPALYSLAIAMNNFS